MSLRHSIRRVRAALIGLLFGAGAVHLAIVGVLLMLHQRWIIVDTLSLGQAMLVGDRLGAGAMAARARRGQAGRSRHLGIGAIAGAACGVPVAVLMVATVLLPLQSIFIALSPDLVDMLTLGWTWRRACRC